MINIKCSSLCYYNVLKLAICYLTASFCFDNFKRSILLVPLYGVGILFSVLSFICLYKLCCTSVELYGNVLTLRYNFFKHDCIDLVNDTNYEIVINNRKIIISHYGKRVILLKYFSSYNLFRYYISYYVR